MGVKGLWRLLLPIGRRISIETLEGKVLAIDASIWLTQFLQAMRDPDTGSVRPAAHLIGFFRRLAKLRFHGIRPVLVFDGATPEIKLRELRERRRRREQFAATAGLDATQRMAKRLLVEQLKKRRNENKGMSDGGAFAPGFRLPEEEEEEEQQQQQQQNGTNGTNQSDSAATRTAISSADDSHEAILEEVRDLEKQWETKSHPKVDNDWDKAILAEESEDEKEDEYEYSDSIFAGTQDEDSVVNRISAMPSKMRKDAIEDAKRQQRMRSRREFMPVAGQPEEYSQAQLRNFLRSSRLNQKIVDMVQKSVAEDSEQGERVASDASRRIIFTKDSETDKKGRRQWARLQKLSSSNGKTGSSSDDDDEDEEFQWEDGNERRESTEKMRAERITQENDTASSKLIPPDRQILAICDSDSEAEEGGFLRHQHNNDAHERVPGSGQSEDGGFFTRSDATKLSAEQVIDVGSHSSEEDGGEFLRSTHADTRKAQELEDEMLAHAIHESASAAAKMAQSEAANNRQTNQRVSLVGGASQLEISEQDEDSSTDDFVEWEDGEDVPVSSVVPESLHEQNGEFQDSESQPTNAKNNDDPNFEASFANEATKQYEEAPARQVELKPRETSAKLTAELSEEGSSGFVRDALHRHMANKRSFDHQASGSEEGAAASSHPDRNSEALAHAQETAASLTNWAGRAFRRAIAQHQEEIEDHSRFQSTPAERLDVAVDWSTEDNGSLELGSRRPPIATVDVDVEKDARNSCSTTRMSNSSDPLNFSPLPMHGQTDKRVDVKEVDAPNGGPEKQRSDSTDLNQPSSPLSTFYVREDESADRNGANEGGVDSVTDEMKADIIQLIHLFGVPYVEAPAEAEAQCATLEEFGLVDGIVTEDSDVFVFGGKTVYKNIFDDQKYVEVYLSKDAKRDLALERNHMVALAMLLGGDYTEGVKGVGIVNGMEILQAFDMSESVRQGLSEFRQWLDGFDPSDGMKKDRGSEALSSQERFHAKHRSARTRWVAPKYFPADNVLNAYLNPVVDKSRRPFSWGTPDLDNLLIFCRDKLGWEIAETKSLLEPVLKRLENTSRQTRIESFFMKYEDNIKFAAVKSKRLQQVFQDIQTANDVAKPMRKEVSDHDNDGTLSDEEENVGRHSAWKRRKKE